MKKSEKIILETAIEVFTKNPNASIELVLEESNISRATFYKYFSSKNELVEKLMLFSLEESERLLVPIFVDENIPNNEKLKLMFRVLIPMGESFNFLNLFPEIFSKSNIQEKYEEQMGELEKLLQVLQSEQKISSNMPMEWLLEFCDALIYAGWRALAKGTVASQKIGDYAYKSFINGAQ